MKTILDTVFLFSITPAGFVIFISSLLFCEYVIARSIIKDIGIKRIKEIFNYVKNHALKFTFLTYSQLKTLKVIFKKKDFYFESRNAFEVFFLNLRARIR